MCNQKVVEICKQLRTQSKHRVTKFWGILPKIFLRKLYLSKKYTSIFQLTRMVGGVIKKQVRKALNLERKFIATPVLPITSIKNIINTTTHEPHYVDYRKLTCIIRALEHIAH